METADELLAAGNIEGARRDLVEALRANPRDERARMFLFQLLCVTGEWEKASAQLRALAQLNPDAQMLATVYSQIMAAEATRAKAFAGEAPVALLVDSTPWLDKLARALEAFSRRDAEAGNSQRDEAFDEAPDTGGMLNDHAFARLADMDGRFGPVLEAIVAGRWGLIAFEAISQIRCEGPKDLRDLVWLPVEITLRAGPGLAGFLPARYPGSELATEGNLRLGRRTEWRSGVSGEEGIGQRQWFTDDGTESGIMSLRHLVFS